MITAAFVWTARNQLRALCIESDHESRARIEGNAYLGRDFGVRGPGPGCPLASRVPQQSVATRSRSPAVPRAGSPAHARGADDRAAGGAVCALVARGRRRGRVPAIGPAAFRGPSERDRPHAELQRSHRDGDDERLPIPPGAPRRGRAAAADRRIATAPRSTLSSAAGRDLALQLFDAGLASREP